MTTYRSSLQETMKYQEKNSGLGYVVPKIDGHQIVAIEFTTPPEVT